MARFLTARQNDLLFCLRDRRVQQVAVEHFGGSRADWQDYHVMLGALELVDGQGIGQSQILWRVLCAPHPDLMFQRQNRRVSQKQQESNASVVEVLRGIVL